MNVELRWFAGFSVLALSSIGVALLCLGAAYAKDSVRAFCLGSIIPSTVALRESLRAFAAHAERCVAGREYADILDFREISGESNAVAAIWIVAVVTGAFATAAWHTLFRIVERQRSTLGMKRGMKRP
ncbi:MAG: hypothetical protein ACREHD_04020 [Pirellulales bacterium]